MSHELDPKVGRWYRRLDDERLFKVATIDEDDGTVEIVTADGEMKSSTRPSGSSSISKRPRRPRTTSSPATTRTKKTISPSSMTMTMTMTTIGMTTMMTMMTTISSRTADASPRS